MFSKGLFVALLSLSLSVYTSQALPAAIHEGCPAAVTVTVTAAAASSTASAPTLGTQGSNTNVGATKAGKNGNNAGNKNGGNAGTNNGKHGNTAGNKNGNNAGNKNGNKAGKNGNNAGNKNGNNAGKNGENGNNAGNKNGNNVGKGSNAGKGSSNTTASTGSKGSSAGNSTVSSITGSNSTVTNSTASSINSTSPSSPSVDVNAGSNKTAAASSGNLQTSLTLDPSQVAPGFAQNGQAVAEAGQVPSLTSTNNFINFCATQPGLPITNGVQIATGSCNPAIMGIIPPTENMPSSKFTFPPNFGTMKSNTPFTISMAINNLDTGNFVNADLSYFAAPQQTTSSGVVTGHSHVVVETLTSLNQTTPTNPEEFAFFKGLNAAAVGGVLTAAVAKGLPAGAYKLSSINTAANHQPVLVPVAQHGTLDDAIYFTVSDDADASANVASGGAAAKVAAASSAEAALPPSAAAGSASAASASAVAVAAVKKASVASASLAAKPTA